MGIGWTGRRARRALAALTAVIALATGSSLAVAAGSPTPAGAQTPQLVVEPSTGLVDGQQVTATVNLTGMFTQVAQCPGTLTPTVENLRNLCDTNWTSVQGDARPAQVQLTVHSTVRSGSGGTFDCGLQPGDCAIVAVAADSGPSGPVMTGFASVPITIEPPVFAAQLPAEPLADGAQVDVYVRGTPGETVAVAQCASPVAPARADSRCGPPLDVLLDADGRVMRSFTVVANVDTGGDPLDCRVDTCALAAFDPGGALLRELPIEMRAPLALTVAPAAALEEGATVAIEVTGYRKVDSEIWQCRADATPDDLGRYCVPLNEDVPAGWLPVWREAKVKASFTPAMGAEVTCGNAPGDCVVLTGTNGWSPWAAAPVTFARTSFAPSGTGLLDGQPMTLTATGLVPDATYRVVRCAYVRGVQCAPDEAAATTDSQGSLQVEATAAQRFTPETSSPPVYCRDGCGIWLFPEDAGQRSIAAPYAMASGSLTATPATGLADGDTVTLAGEDLMASYDGPRFWLFPSTGGWGVGQCDAAVRDEPTIVGVFTHCTVAPPGVVDVPGSTATVDVSVAASFTSILGDEVDCTVAPDACVFVLTRVEQDGSVSLHAAPISLG